MPEGQAQGLLPQMRSLRQKLKDKPDAKLSPAEAMFVDCLTMPKLKPARGRDKPLVASRAIATDMYKDIKLEPGSKKYDTAMIDFIKSVATTASTLMPTQR